MGTADLPPHVMHDVWQALPPPSQSHLRVVSSTLASRYNTYAETLGFGALRLVNAHRLWPCHTITAAACEHRRSTPHAPGGDIKVRCDVIEVMVPSDTHTWF